MFNPECPFDFLNMFFYRAMYEILIKLLVAEHANAHAQLKIFTLNKHISLTRENARKSNEREQARRECDTRQLFVAF